ncbi:MAG: type VI secretion protein, partial [Pseudomonadota bacterium]
MTNRENDIRIKPGRIRDKGPSTKRAQSFVGQVMQAARKAGHTGYRFGGPKGGSRFGRGKFVRTARGLSNARRRVVIKARVVRHRCQKFRSAPLSKHLDYL